MEISSTFPVSVCQEERDRARDRGKLVVVDEDDAARPHEPREIDEVDEDTVEAVVPVHDGEVEPLSGRKKSRQRDLRLLRVQLHELEHARFLEEL